MSINYWFLYMVLLRNGKMTTLSDTRFKLKINIGASAICILYGRDIHDVTSDTILSAAPADIAALVTHSLHHIGGGWTAARQSDFLGVVKRGELNYYLLLDDGDEFTLGRDSSQIQRNMALVKELAEGSPSATIVVRAIGFGKDDPAGSLLNSMGRLNMKQNVTALTGSGMISIIGNTSYVPTHSGSNADAPPIELYAMEDRMNAKECHRLETAKCAGRSHVME
jgi:hypothetical protein